MATTRAIRRAPRMHGFMTEAEIIASITTAAGVLVRAQIPRAGQEFNDAPSALDEEREI